MGPFRESILILDARSQHDERHAIVQSLSSIETSASGGHALLTERLLAWYDRHGRALPWRAGRGEPSDPYRVWLSEVMLQQTTVKAVIPYYLHFVERWPTVHELASAPLEQILRAWAGLGYYSRARNLHRTARIVVEEFGGAFPPNVVELRELPGVGEYTAAAISAIAFARRATVVDGNVERVIARTFAVGDSLPKARTRIRRLVESLTPSDRPGDFAQAMMDLGATLCTPRQPSCELCPWTEPCAVGGSERALSFPVRAPRVARPTRRGAAFLAVREDGAVLLRRRPEKGLLGGMVEVPGTAWRQEMPGEGLEAEAPLPGVWRRVPEPVTHIFTHFRLELAVFVARFPPGTPAPSGTWWSGSEDVAREALPRVMAKVLACGRSGPRPIRLRSRPSPAGPRT